MFDHERLHVYQLQLRFITWATDLMSEVRMADRRCVTREVRDQLDRASLSGLLNTAEGNGKRQRQLRARYFDDARGSAAECSACLDALVAKRICAPGRVGEGKEMLDRIGQMLTKMVTLYSDDAQVREERVDYVVDPL